MEKKVSRREFDDVFRLVRTFGPYQFCLYIGSCLMQIPMSLQFGQSIFALGTPLFHCTDTNSTCPPNKCCTNCTSYGFDGPFTSTVSEWNLLCDRAYLGAAIQSSYFAGMLIGSLLSGWLADSFGRRKCMFISTGVFMAFSVGVSFADCISLLILLRFVVGFALAGLMLTQFVYIVELVGPNARTHAGKAQGLFWKFGGWITVLLAYFIRDWRYHILIGSFPGLILFLFWRVFPDTARWLLANGRIDEAQAILTKCGGEKKKPLDQKALRAVLEDVRRDQIEREKKTNVQRHTPMDLLRTPKMRRWTIIVCYNWFVVALVFFGFDLYTVRLPGSIYLNYFIMNLIDIPVLGLAWVLLHKVGRRIPYCGFMFVVGISSFIITSIPSEHTTAITALAIIGRSFVWSEFCNIYLITTELFPTVVRNTSMGVGSMFARVGAILSPFIVMVAQLPGLSITLPVTIFGVLALIAGIVTLWIPETLHANMHQTIEEAEAAKENFGILCFRKVPPDVEQCDMPMINVDDDERERLNTDNDLDTKKDDE